MLPNETFYIIRSDDHASFCEIYFHLPEAADRFTKKLKQKPLTPRILVKAQSLEVVRRFSAPTNLCICGNSPYLDHPENDEFRIRCTCGLQVTTAISLEATIKAWNAMVESLQEPIDAQS